MELPAQKKGHYQWIWSSFSIMVHGGKRRMYLWSSNSPLFFCLLLLTFPVWFLFCLWKVRHFFFLLYLSHFFSLYIWIYKKTYNSSVPYMPCSAVKEARLCCKIPAVFFCNDKWKSFLKPLSNNLSFYQSLSLSCLLLGKRVIWGNWVGGDVSDLMRSSEICGNERREFTC